MTFEITRFTLNNGNIIKSFDPIRIECSQADFDFCIIDKIKIMIAINNLHFKLIGSDNRCIYHVMNITDKTVKEFCEYANNYIESGLKQYNKLVNELNVDIKRSNKKNNRPIKLGLLDNVTLTNVCKDAKDIRVVNVDDRLVIQR